MRILATAAAAVVAATVVWSSAGAVDVQIHGFEFGCVTPDGETRKPKFGDVDGIYFTGLPEEQKPCLETIDRMIYSCTANTTFISHDLNDRFPGCLKIFARQASRCVRHFQLEQHKCFAGDTLPPVQTTAEPDGPEVEPADLTMWAAKRSNLRSGPGTDHAKVGLLEIGDEVQVTGEIGDWLRIEAPGGGDAFVWAPLLTDEGPSRATAATARERDRQSSIETARASGIPDRATRNRVADRLERCNRLWHIGLRRSGVQDYDLVEKHEQERFLRDLKEIQADRAVVADAREYIEMCVPMDVMLRDEGLPCRQLAFEIWSSISGTTAEIVRNAEEYLDKRRLSRAQTNIVEDYLGTCVPAYAAVIDGGSESSAARTSDQPRGRDPLHGSITFSQEADGGYAWGIAWSFDNHPVALAESLDKCREYGGRSCTEVGWFQDACGALAIGDGNGYGAGWGDTTAEAERDALSQCRAANENCRIEVARCSKSQEAGGSGRTEDEHGRMARAMQEDIPVDADSGQLCGDNMDERETAQGCRYCVYLGNQGPLILLRDKPTNWSGLCENGIVNGNGALSFDDGISSLVITGTISRGIPADGLWVWLIRHPHGHMTERLESRYVKGKLHGVRTNTWTRQTESGGTVGGRITETFSNGEGVEGSWREERYQ